MAEGEKKSGKGKLIIIMTVILLCVVGGLVVFMMTGSDDSNDPNQAAEPVVAPEPIFVKVGPMTVNLASDEYSQHLLYCGLTLKVDNKETEDFIKTHLPEVHSRLLLLLSSKTAKEITSPDGKIRLTGEILALFDAPLSSPQPELAISSVLFTEFIVQ